VREREREMDGELQWTFDSPSLTPSHPCYDRAAKTIRLGNEKWNAKSLGPLLLHEKHIGGGSALATRRVYTYSNYSSRRDGVAGGSLISAAAAASS